MSKVQNVDAGMELNERSHDFLKKDEKFLGGSVTAPYKIEIMKYLDEIDFNAKKIGSILICCLTVKILILKIQ